MIFFSFCLFQRICRYDDPVQLPADGDVGSGLDGGALQGHVHEGRSHQKLTKLEPNQTKQKHIEQVHYKAMSMKEDLTKNQRLEPNPISKKFSQTKHISKMVGQ